MESMVQKMRKMKDSGIEWIGEIPEGWEISKVSYFYEVQLGKMLQPQKKSETDTEEKYLCAANVGKNSLSLDTLKTMWFSQTEKHQFDLKEGDLLVVEGGDVASCAIIETPVRNLFFQNALHRVRPLHNESVAFLRYWLMTAKSYGYIDLICNKATIAHFSKEKFIALPIPVIPQDIQSKIVSFLDLECKQIDDLLSKSRSSIEEYKKLKQAVITQAVTKGMRGEREMKDSGVEWIGEIPKEWGRTKIKMIASFFNGDRTSRYPQPSDFVDAGVAFLTSRNIDSDEVDLSETKYITDDKYKSLSGAKIQIDDIIFCLRGSVGKCAINRTLSCGTVASSLATIRPKDIYPKYLLYFLLSNIASTQTTIFMNGTCAANLSAENVGNYYITLPISTEQKEIADYLDAKCAEIDKLIAKKEQLVKEMESYKKSLIYEVVTGKREV